MEGHTKSYLAFKTESERITNLIVLISHAVPVLARVLGSSAAVSAQIPLKPADNFPHDKTTGPVLLNWAGDYDRDLSHVVLLSVFSYFEGYVRGVIAEIYKRQGGEKAFIALSKSRATRHWSSPPTEITGAKAKLQAADDPRKAARAQKYSRILVEAGFAFPPDLLAVYGALKLAEKLERKGRNELKAWEIPDLLSQALMFEVTRGERDMYTELRTLRNQIGHGSAPKLTVHSAIKKTTALRKWATKIDAHIAEHFLVLAKHAG
jgi:hypothetical protein